MINESVTLEFHKTQDNLPCFIKTKEDGCTVYIGVHLNSGKNFIINGGLFLAPIQDSPVLVPNEIRGKLCKYGPMEEVLDPAVCTVKAFEWSTMGYYYYWYKQHNVDKEDFSRALLAAIKAYGEDPITLSGAVEGHDLDNTFAYQYVNKCKGANGPFEILTFDKIRFGTRLTVVGHIGSGNGYSKEVPRFRQGDIVELRIGGANNV